MTVSRLLALAAAAVLLAAPGARALVMREAGSRADLSGPIVPGDGAAFAAFLQAHPAIRIVWLDSSGGKVREGVLIGREIRRARLQTAVDAGSARCDSACTLIFVAGTRRFYAGDAGIHEGLSGRVGLGFHAAHRPGSRREEPMLNERGTDTIRRFYGEMGVPRAVELVEKASFNTLYRPSGATALALGIATSLEAP